MHIPIFLFILLLSRVSSQEVSTPSSQLRPRNFNHHPIRAQEDLKSLKLTEPTKQGPVLFPNDAPPPPRPPLIVTSRPLEESIARSELAENNTVASQSQVNRVSFVPFLAKVKDYRPYIPSPSFDYQFLPTRVPYADVVQKSILYSLERDNRYDDFEEHTILPPIYKALSDHAQQKVLKSHREHHNYQPTTPHQSSYSHRNHNDGNDDNNAEYNQNQNYAFSYTVKDQKTGDDFSHSQHSSGSATNGEYRVRLPDGRMQIVSYTADENGYKADVRYDDEDKTTGNTIEDGFNQHKDKIRHDTHNDYKKHNYHNHKDYNQHAHHKHDNYHHNNYIPNNYAILNQHNDYTDTNHDYVDVLADKKDFNNDKLEKDYYSYPDVSKEYYTDYSSEYNSNYEPHKSKFTFVNDKNVDVGKAIGSTVKPSYEELKDLFVNRNIYSTQRNFDSLEPQVSTTPLPYGTTEHLVLIGHKQPNLYTNIKHSLPINVTPSPVSYSTPNVVIATTPRSYLLSTIASLKNKIHLGDKPILSENYINKINKYLSFN